jgi:hypothetical protein
MTPNDDTDLEAQVAELEALVRSASSEDRGELLGMLVYACFTLYFSDPGQLDRLVGQARAAWAEPSLPDEMRPNVGLILGIGLFSQNSGPDAQPDWDAVSLGIEVLTTALHQGADSEHTEPDLSVAAESTLGFMLLARGQMNGSMTDMAAAGPYLVNAASRLDPGDEKWAEVIHNLAIGEALLAGTGLGAAHSDRAVQLLRAAIARPQANPEEEATLHMALGAILVQQMIGRRGPAADEGIKELQAAYTKAPAHSPVRLQVAWNLASVLASRFFMNGDRQALQAARFYFDSFEKARSEWPAPLEDQMPGLNVLSAALDGDIALARDQTGEPGVLGAGIRSLRKAVNLAGPGHPQIGWLRSDLGQALLARHDDEQDLADLQEAIAELAAGAELLPPGHLMHNVAQFRAASAAFRLGLANRDPRQVRAAISQLVQVRADRIEGAADPLRETAQMFSMYAELYGLTRDAADLATAREWAAAAAAEFDREPGHPMHGPLLMRLAMLEHDAGQLPAAIGSGRAALRIRARDVLLQTGPARGLAAARVASREAVQVAGWCLEGGSAAPAAEALELGRGLVLYAATVAADMPTLLTDAGHHDLADSWRSLIARREEDQPWDVVPGARDMMTSRLPVMSLAVPSDLRERTLNALGVGALATAPGYREIAGALARTGADALVYLLLPADGGTGQAVVIPASGGAPYAVPLPLLDVSSDSALGRFGAAQDKLLNLDEDGEALEQWRRAFDPLCEWAWDAVMKPLLDRLPSAVPGEPPRLVLIPAGRLAIVPWHAARHLTGPETSWRYAIADAVVSYAASGRQLTEVSQRAVPPLASDPVVVAPPDAGLRFARIEVEAFRGCYPTARCLDGDSESPKYARATPGNVLGVLPAREHRGASVLHLACHGTATSAGADASCLELLGQAKLTVKEILRQAAGRPPGAPGGLVDLIACRTDVTAADYDEALTLATAFLTAGAATVIGSRWSIPDKSSAVLMYMFHHYLADNRSPRDALRAAQLWILDPKRPVPDTMPEALRRAAKAPLLARPEFWAGLIHQGQ